MLERLKARLKNIKPNNMYKIEDIKVGDLYRHKKAPDLYFLVSEIHKTGLIVSTDVSRKRPKDVFHVIEEVEVIWSKK